MRWKHAALAAAVGTATVVSTHQAWTETATATASHLRETGCRDVVAGSARYERDRVVDGLPVSDADYPTELKQDRGRLVAALHLAAPSCSTVDYLLHAYRPDGSLLLSRVVSGATGLQEVEFSVQVLDYPEDCLAVQFVTRVGDVVVDRAPDALVAHDTVCDGHASGLAYK